MKKTLLLTILLFQLTLVFGQTMQTTNGGKGYSGTAGAMERKPQYIPSGNSNNSSNNNNNSNSSEVNLSDPCYKNLFFTVKNYGYSKDGGYYSWGIKVRNGYSKAVSLKYKLIVGNDNTSPSAKYGTTTYEIKPGETYHNDYGTMMALIVNNNSEQFRIEVSDVCFQGQDCIKNGYADCNGNQRANTNDKVTSTNTNQTNNSNTSNTQQNDLTEYNRSKADLERQMQQKNQEIVNQNAEAQRQQFNRLYNEGVSLKNSGNLGAAKNRFNDALKFATNNSERQKAQDAINQINSDSDAYIAKTVTQGANIIVNGVQQQIEWAAEQKRLKAEKIQRINDDIIKEDQKFANKINLADNGDYEMQRSVAGQYYDKQKYALAEEYFELAINNKEHITHSDLFIGNLASCYALNGKYVQQWERLNEKCSCSFSKYINGNAFKHAMLVLFSKKYEIDVIVSDEMRRQAIEDLKSDKMVEIYHRDDAKVALAYFQVTGEYEGLGIHKNEEEGIATLTKSSSNDLASYFMGILYLNGTSTIKKDEKKAFNSFLNVITIQEPGNVYKKLRIDTKKDLEYYKPILRHDYEIYQFTPLILAYSEISKILNKSPKEDDKHLLKYKYEFLEWYGNLLSVEDRSLWGVKANRNPFLKANGE